MATPRFEFRLEVLLQHRLRIEKERQQKVAEIQQQVQLIVREIQEAQARIAEENKTLAAQKLIGVLDMQYIAHEKKFVGNLHMKVVMSMQRLMGVEKQLNAARAQLLIAAKSRKILEKLKEKQHALWLTELERKEAAMLDEIGTQNAIRQANLARIEEEIAAMEA